MFFGAMLSYFLMIGGVLMAIGLSINAVWRAIMPPSGLPRDGAACGSCGYELVTLAEGRCSECGADLLKSGVNTRHTMVRTAGSLAAAVMGWSIIMIVLTSVVFGVGLTFVAMSGVSTMTTSQALTTTQSFRPDRFDNDGNGVRTRSAEYEIEIIFDGEYDWNAGAQTGTLTVEVSGDDATTPLTLEFDVETEGFTLTGADGTLIDTGTGYTGDDAETLLAAAGLDTADPALAYEAQQLGDLFEGALDDPMNFETSVLMMNVSSGPGGLSNTGSSVNYGGGPAVNLFSSSSTEMIVAGGILVLGVLIYAVGLVFIVRRRGRMIARPRAHG